MCMIQRQKLENLFAFSSWFKHGFPWSEEKKILILLSLLGYCFNLRFNIFK